MRHLDTLATVTALATSTGRGHIAFTTPVGADLSNLADVLPEEARASAMRSGTAILAFDGSADALLAYSAIERRMSLAPGGMVILAQGDGTVLTRAQDLGNIVPVDFTVEAAPLRRAA